MRGELVHGQEVVNVVCGEASMMLQLKTVLTAVQIRKSMMTSDSNTTPLTQYRILTLAYTSHLLLGVRKVFVHHLSTVEKSFAAVSDNAMNQLKQKQD